MKQKIILTGSLLLLLAVVLFMAKDIFFSAPDQKNPYAYDLSAFREGDTSLVLYDEVLHFDAGSGAIHGIALDKTDRMYVCGENHVTVYTPPGKPELDFAVNGTATAITVSTDGRIFVAMTDHIEVFDRRGKLVRQWKSPGDGAIITSVATTDTGVFFADAGNKIVYHTDFDGNLLQKIGEKDPSRNIPGFVVPSPYFDLGIDKQGALWVVNPGRHQFEKYDPEGAITATWGISSMSMEGFCGCCNPSHFAVLSDGSFVTSEKGIERIKVYRPDGTFRCVVAGPDAFTEGTRGLDLAVDSRDRIVVLDPERGMIRIFGKKEEGKTQVSR
jgi:sugar lactone lactonase YvrE